MLNSKRLWTTTILLGIAFDILFWKKIPGISFAIFVTLVLVSGVRVLREDGFRPHARTFGLLLPIGFFAVMTFIRAEPLTTFLNYLLTLVFMGFFALSYLGGRWLDYSISDYIAGYVRLGLVSMIGRPLSFIIETRKQRDQAEGESEPSRVAPILRGLLIALPIVAIFASLLSSADLVFAQQMDAFIELFRLEKLPEYIFRGFYILVIAYALVGALLYAALKSRDETLIGEEKPFIAPFLGFTESSIVLGSVLLLFAAFVLVQFQYFFGGQANINIEGYTYAEYARRGFGELVAVAFFSLLLFLGLSAITRRADKQQKTFSAMGVTLVLFVLVMLVSALKRLALYEAAYGFSRMRAYPHVFMLWLGALLIAVVVLEFLGKRRLFAPAMAFAIIGFAASLNLMNVDAFIVRHNVERSLGGAKLDMAYLASLSDDAIPALAAQLDNKSASLLTRESVAASLVCAWYQDEFRYTETRSWQSFHLAQWKASQTYAEINPLEGYTYNYEDWYLIVTSPSGVKFACHDREIWD